MHIYDVGYYTYEESANIQLYHEKSFNKEEFEKIIIKAAANTFKDCKIEKDECVSFQDILSDVIDELIKNFGFKKVEFTSRFNIFGWADILDENDWKYDRDEQLKLLTKELKKARKQRKLLIEGCKETAKESLKICKEFKYADEEVAKKYGN